ncbi:GNAT family N-acetyltransferase [Galbibacter mesophilus]|uniref:GNAT family N-acetyltransferase n=1 Tax=Galbibacter mesophilus TaxID=379069 RepID=UPI00191E2826|nr:GNAT family N-acetyltransferase [Galbibacter mesophilus]MCM5662930.1 GNAT family N-acetyltransferase [Galbibacter mesophilus]
MIKLIRTDASHLDFQHLVKHLDVYLAKMDGDAHAFYDQFNKIENLTEVVLCYKNEKPVACGAFKSFDKDTAEIKRMYVDPNSRGEGVASAILKELEKWAVELGFKTVILETGSKYEDAIALYLKNGYKKFPNYGQYQGSDLSVCFNKVL